ncbi:sperm-associated antigen 17-like isoform X2 [Gigantopelta aegis]|uniref:sperm-associated antigen 17-like isoform X2 n=1 Tax=Gigantopelta aegis TaxID=1735272 RepID=UPI001B88A9B4|nr:sperm-associated antigen 17-like isoform X2 [Gigantopelta aegis]
MAKAAKRVKSGHLPSGGANKWEQNLLSAVFDEEKWKSNITFIVGNRPEDYSHINALSSAVASGIRKLFTVISKEQLDKEVNELGNPKNKKTKDVPAHYEVCEACKLYLDINEEIPLPLLARLIKFKLLTVKAADLKRRETEKKSSADKGKGKDKKDARSKSPGKKGGRKTPDSQSAKEGSKLRKRGEEDNSSKYIDDEPDDGAEHYILLYGFNNPNLFAQLAEISINVDAIIKVSSQDYSIFEVKESETNQTEKDEKTLALEEAARQEKAALSKELKKFWKDVVLLLQKNPDNSKLHDIAQLEYEVKSLIIPSNLEDLEQKTNFGNTLFEDISVMIYDLIDARRLYRTYLENLKLYHIPSCLPSQGQDAQSTGSATPGKELPAATSLANPDDAPLTDMRYYNDLMNTIPQESVSVSLVLHCMLEQICATDEGREPPSEVPPPARTDGLNSELAAHLSNVAFKLALTEEEHKVLSKCFELPELPQDSPNQPLIINYHDDITIRTHHLKPVYEFDAMEAEKAMQKRLPFASLCDLPRPTSVVARERAARLQELIHFCATETLSKSEIDRAFKQFVFESMDLKVTDPNGFIMTLEGEGLLHSAIPWDDPYPFFKGMIPKHDKSLSPNITNQPTTPSDELMSGTSSPCPFETNRSLDLSNVTSDQSRPSTGESSKKGILRSSSRSESPPIKQSRSNSVTKKEKRVAIRHCVHFEVDANSSVPPETLDEEEENESKETENDEKTLEESMMEIVDSQKRVLDQWCFAEHFEPHIMLQILKDASYNLQFMDTYYHKRDHTLLVCLHNPHNPEVQNHVDWHCEVHSNLGFRNYLEYVSDSIADWLKEKEAEYQATILQLEVDKFKKEEELAAKSAEKTQKGRKQSPAKSRSRSPKGGSKSSSRERTPTPLGSSFVRPGSLKAWKMEQDQIKAEEDEKERQKAEKAEKRSRSKSPKKKDDEKDEKEKKRPSSRNSAKKGSQKGQAVPSGQSTESVDIPLEDKKFWKFFGYDVGNNLIHASGILTTMLPSDGGQIRMERTDFVQGTSSVKTSVLKDGHVFSIHILNPKEPLEEETEENDVLEKDDQREKAEFEKTEKEENKDDEHIDEEVPKSVDQEQEEVTKKPFAVSAFGSITASLVDGMVLSYSCFGPNGETDAGKRYEPEPYVPPPTIQSPTPPAVSPSKGKKDKGKGAATPEPREMPVEEEVLEEEKAEVEAPTEQPFQQLFVTCPDGLNVRYFLESSVGVKPNSPEERRIVVKQSYPFKTKFIQSCEAPRKKYALTENSRLITSEGTVIKDMVDGSVEVLYADGTVSRHIGPWPIIASRSVTPVRVSSSRSHEDRVTPTKKGKTGKSSSHRQTNEKTEAQQQQPAAAPTEEVDKGTWLTTYPNGEQLSVGSDGTVKELKPVMICVASDPETRQAMSTREDHVITVSYPDGTTIIEHSDGTRITTYYRENQAEANADDETDEMSQLIKFIKIECPGMATVEFNCNTSENLTVFGNGTTINVFPDGFYVLHHGEGGRIELDTEGTFIYFPRPIKNMEQLLPERELQYVMRHNAEVICETMDPDGNIFHVKYTGDFVVTMSNGDELVSLESLEEFKQEKTVSQYMQHAPRFFIIHADGSGTELLRYQDVAEYLMTAEQSQSTAVLKDLLPDYPGVTGITILKPYLGGPSERWMKKYDLESIIPRGIQSRDLTTLPPKEFKTPGPEFGTTVGKGLAVGSIVTTATRFPIVKCPSILELRQFVQYNPVTASLRATLRSGLREYAEYVMTRNRAAEMMQCMDPRSEEEKMAAADLQATMSPKKSDSMQFVPADIKEIYEKATAPPAPSPPPTPTAKRCQADWERDQREVAEEMEGREAIRIRKIPQYFDSELGKAFLLSQTSDVDQLMRELGQDPRTDGTEAIRRDPGHLAYLQSPLEKQVVLYQPVYSAQSDRTSPSASPAISGNAKLPSGTPVSYSAGLFNDTPSGLRPCNPTPAHAAGQGSPAPVRPKNPTPAHATKILEKDRPGNPTPKLAAGKDSSSAESENQKNGYALIPEQPTEEEPKTADFINSLQEEDDDLVLTRSLKVNVVGEPRKEPVRIPASILGGRPGATPNERFCAIEEPVRRQINNSMIAGATMKGQMQLGQMRGLSLVPEEVNFGVLREGNTYSVTVNLKNTGIDSCRFNVKQPPPATGLIVLYKPGPVAAGLKTELNLELYAIAVGVEGDSGVGTINHELIIVTETDILKLPITAIVLTGYDYDNRSPDSPMGGKSPGTRLVSTKPPSTTGIIRPRREYMIAKASS